ncbi:TetR/AcrR family transcriptional regulator [Paenibacillus sp. TAB 01]|uniref:TetR/AcrR family transcriptional regulator n=1 Tax=Paenibacillus sp. TAB 01 TaxID=3368988 RepID=UPI003750775F
MSMIKQEIVRSAAKLFSINGFAATSIQDIADDCRIAKGSVYKYFPSKEDLFSEVLEQFLNRYFDEVERIKRLPGLSPKEHFLKQLIFRFQYFMENKYILAEYNVSIRQDAKFMPQRLQTRGRLMNWYKECLLQVYGPEMEPYIWDLVFTLKALLKDFLNWAMHEREPLSIEETAAFILDRMDGISAHMVAAGKKPMLTASFFDRYIHWGRAGDQEADRPLTVGALLDRLAAEIGELPTGETERGELLELIRLLREETAKERPNGPMILALLAYLERENELKSLSAQLKNIILP